MPMQTKTDTNQSGVLIFEPNKTPENNLNLIIPGLSCIFKKVSNSDEFLRQIRTSDYALALFNSISDPQEVKALVKAAKNESPETGLIVITDTKNQKSATELSELGLTDILLGPVPAGLLISKIAHACEVFRDKRELLSLRQQVAMSYAFDNFIGLSAEIQKIKRVIQNVVNNDFPVILSGEDGTGKKLLARIIHHHSLRRKSPLAELDCSAITSLQLESDLFGANHPPSNNLLQGGLFQRGNRGTVFIDKLHLLETSNLSKLQKLIMKITLKKGNLQNGDPDFRLIISINESLYDSYAKGTIDRKFIDSLNAVEINLPPLRERIGDIELLTAYFLRMIAFESDSETVSITPPALELLKSHLWPGNVRELENCLRRAAALCNNRTIDIANISFISAGLEFNRLANIMKNKTAGNKSLADGQRNLIEDALEANRWNYTQTAKQLGIGRTTLWRKVRMFNLKRGPETADETSLAEKTLG